uniref:AT-hook motif nuclear-localized protein n=1 Tax=Kalanchoe fedtschenkoi TaxID=63787 RepID=A0A7N0UPX1_KALFE
MDPKDATTLPGSGPDDIQQSDVGGGGYMDSLKIEPIPTSSTASVDVILPSAAPQQKRERPAESEPDRDVPLGQTTPPTVPNETAALGGSLTSSTDTRFTSFIIKIAAGEDIASKIMSFSKQYPRAVCILTAAGSVSTATIAHPSTPGLTHTYTGEFSIISLSGSYLVTDSDGLQNGSGRLTITLQGPDMYLIGGAVSGMLIAASPVEVIVGSFMWASSKTANISSMEAQENKTDSDRLDLDHPVTPDNIHSNQ